MTSENYRERLHIVCDGLRQNALEIIKQTDLKFAQHGMVHPNILALTLLSRTLSNFRALMLLTKERMVVEARVLARCCFENFFIVCGLHAEGATFAERMKEDDLAGRKGRIRFALETEAIFESLSPEMQESVREHNEAFRNAPKVGFLKPKHASDAGEFKETYLAYSQFSGDAAHPTLTALARHWAPGPSVRTAYFNADPEPNENELDETLELASIALISMMVMVNEMVGCTEAGKKLLELNHELKVLQAEKWGSETIREGMEIRTEKLTT
jgi:Family of unknown function (DUF5677)